MYAYKNRNTSQIVGFTEQQPRLEALNEWETVDAATLPPAAAAAFDRAAAERASIQAAAQVRFDTAAGKAQHVLAAAADRESDAGGGTVPSPLPTLSVQGAAPTQASSLVAALDKSDPARRVQASSYEQNQAAAEEELRNPPTDGVLARAKADQRTGRTQVGPNPQEHPQATATGGSGEGGRPADNAAKADWVAYAVTRGADEQEASKKSRADLIEQYGQQ